ncbi:MAG: hypothetical protein FIB07_06340 [Candidatus Methanoperedens sp.]|nr:hypothetical protein [Candidatus Methanoperedens sp.]
MKAEKRSGKAKSKKKNLASECPSPKETEMTPEDISKHIPQCENVADGLMALTDDAYWKQMLEIGKKHFDNESLAKEFFKRGSVSMLLLMISLEMPPEFLDRIDEILREAKKMRVGEGK